MIFFLCIMLAIIGLPLWLWLASRISQVSNTGALLSLFLVLPAFYWSIKLWHNRRADLRVPAIANLLLNLIALPALLLYSTHYATSQARAAAVPKENPQMVRWCQEQNDAAYDPILEMCVEPNKADVLAQEKRDNVMGQLEQYFNQHGVIGTLERSITPEITALKTMPEIADAASYHFLSPAMTRHPAFMLLCISASACAQVASKENKDGAYIGLAQGTLLLLIAPDSIDNVDLKKLKAVTSHFKPT
jgi:hypothetical protein